MPPTHGRAAFPARCWLLGALFGLALYGATAAPGVVWQDGGDAQVRVALDDLRGPFDLARAHVLHLLLASGLKHALRLDPAWAANLLSVLAGAVTLANVAALLWLLMPRPLPVVAATLLLACSHTLWQFSTMAETNALVAALLSAELLALRRFAATGRGRFLWLVGLLNGLGVSNHNLALLTLVCYAIAAFCLIRRWKRDHVLHGALGTICWLVGAAPLLVLLIQEVSGGSTVPAALHSLLIGDFGRQVFNVRFRLSGAAKVLGMILLNFPSPLLLLLPIGLVHLKRLAPGPYPATLALLLGVHFLFAARYNVADQYSFFLPTYCLMTVFIAAGVDRLLRGGAVRGQGSGVRGQVPSPWPLAPGPWATGGLGWGLIVLLWAVLPVPVYAMAPALARALPSSLVPIPTRPVPYRDPYEWFLRPWHRDLDGPRRFAREVFDMLPPDAILLVDPTLRPPLLYLQIVEGLRRDVQINDGLWQPWRTAARIDMNRPEAFDPLVAAGRVFLASDEPAYTPNYGWVLNRYDLERMGHVFRVRARSPSDGMRRAG